MANMTNAATHIIIIGAGIAGLAAGCYAQMNGYLRSCTSLKQADLGRFADLIAPPELPVQGGLLRLVQDLSYQTRIFERHTLPGGLCTAWQRQGFIFDGCIHYLFGSGHCL
jgi:glycine/D-amino acid oxidase-like deaminating enzyme